MILRWVALSLFLTGVGLGLLVGVKSCSAADECGMECLSYADQALKKIGFRPRTIPAVVVGKRFRNHAMYGEEVVYLTDPGDCRAVVHELIHHRQWEREGNAESPGQWNRREMDAAGIAMLAVEIMRDDGIAPYWRADCQ